MRIATWMMTCWLLVGLCTAARSADGLIAQPAVHPPAETLDRLAGAVQSRGLRVFARFDHAGAAAEAGLALRPTQVLLFGHPRGGTPLMQCAQSIAIDLPLKALAWTDEAGRHWIAFNDIDLLARRHGIADCPGLGPVRQLLSALLTEIAAP